MRNGHVGEEWEGNTSIKGKLVALTGGRPRNQKKGGDELIKKEDGEGEMLLGLIPRR